MLFKADLAVLMSLCVSPSFAGESRVPVLANRSLNPVEISAHAVLTADRSPKFVSGKAPVYPVSMLLSGKGGSCLVEFIVGTDGKTKALTVLSPPSKFADHAIIAIRAWVFEPAIRDGVPVEAKVQQSFSYATR